MEGFVMGVSRLCRHFMHTGYLQRVPGKPHIPSIKQNSRVPWIANIDYRMKSTSRRFYRAGTSPAVLGIDRKSVAQNQRLYSSKFSHTYCLTHKRQSPRYKSKSFSCKAGPGAYTNFRDTMTVGECVKTAETLFTEAAVPEPHESAVYLISHVLGRKTLTGINSSKRLNSQQIAALAGLVDLRLTRLPIQYVIGEWDFRSLTLDLEPPVLIPRPETEELVEFIHAQNFPATSHFLEVGSGSGAISCSILTEQPKMTCVAIDLSPDACRLTERNAKKAGVIDRMKIYNTPVHKYAEYLSEKFDFLVSNPPYIKTEDMEKLEQEVSDFEDSLALHGGSDGLDVIRDILEVAPRVLQPGGSIWLEVDSSHPPLIRELVATPKHHPQLTYIATHHDFRNITRFCHLKFDPRNRSST